MDVKDETGIYLVKLARFSAKSWICEGKEPNPISPMPEQAKFTTGVFVTVKTRIGDEAHLRGCIGYPIGIKPLFEEVIDLARDSTLNDPRFDPVQKKELSSLIFEVTVLTPPEEIIYNSPEELLNNITIPGDGLIVKYGRTSGLLLPQVPVEQDWDVEEYISYTCRKAYLSTDIWKKEKIKVEKFQGIVFTETNPEGEIKRVSLSSH
ncbi:MAG: TIGR00296 family protein [Asgard group archaeon]|nr:TIGR00296 family protein [Asgard group archaeon]